MLLQELQQQRQEILQLATQYGAKNLRIFGSVARGEANQNSDIDLLVEMQSSLLTRIALIQDLETLLNTKVDVVTERGLPEHLRAQILKEAIPL
ncbi:MAG: nucleotidyltransferase family protein [Thioploca sp.]|nr:nucleotidyltransferase family protein [Thioploca sp.]